jgi:hypothetical protein
MTRPLGPWESDDNLSMTEDSAERGLSATDRRSHDPVTYRDLGRSDSPDTDDVGDVADEGRGHRG